MIIKLCDGREFVFKDPNLNQFCMPAVLNFFDIEGRMVAELEVESWVYSYRSDVAPYQPVVEFRGEFYKAVEIKIDESRKIGEEQQRYQVTLLPADSTVFLRLSSLGPL